jgi:hypothetical protein
LGVVRAQCETLNLRNVKLDVAEPVKEHRPAMIFDGVDTLRLPT